MSASFVPDHKASMVLFLDRVYGIENQDFLLHVLDVGFLPDMRAAASLDTVSSLATLPTSRVGVAVLKLQTYPGPPSPTSKTEDKRQNQEKLSSGGREHLRSKEIIICSGGSAPWRHNNNTNDR